MGTHGIMRNKENQKHYNIEKEKMFAHTEKKVCD